MFSLPQPLLGLAALFLAQAGALAQGNVLLIIADDIGVDRVGVYAEHFDPGHTPVIDGLAARGVLFRNAWSHPVCSPARAAMLTGRHAFRTGIGKVIQRNGPQFGLPYSEFALPEMLDAGTGGLYAHGAIGKWHLGIASQGGSMHPLLSGFDFHIGCISNLDDDDGADYSRWLQSVNGSDYPSHQYATTHTTDSALRAVERLQEPWCLWVAYNAPHSPFHAPPSNLHSYNLSGLPQDSPVEHMKAMTEALDTELGRLLAGIPRAVRENTTIIFIGDNGTAKDASEAPFLAEHAKGTMYEGGLNVPLIVVSPLVAQPGSECSALVQDTDIFASIAELAGVDLASVTPTGTKLDSRSFVPWLQNPAQAVGREVVFSEKFKPNGFGFHNLHEKAIRNTRYKMIRSSPLGSDEFYDLQSDPFETVDLLLGTLSAEQAAAYTELEAALDRIENS